jgi:hypothetical protein
MKKINRTSLSKGHAVFFVCTNRLPAESFGDIINGSLEEPKTKEE